MTIDYRIVIGGELTSNEKEAVNRVVASVFKTIDTTFNKWNRYSELSRLNELPLGVLVPLSPRLYDFLCKVGEVVEATEGLFDPTIELLQLLWKRKLQRGEIPSDTEVDNLRNSVGWRKIRYREGLFCKKASALRIDLGGIVKGHCVDLLVENLQELGFRDIFVDWGGEIRATGHHPEGRAWGIFISCLGDPDPAHAIDTINLTDAAVATSGDYLQCWRVDRAGESTTYCHIIDPRSCCPLRVIKGSIASATIMAPSCMLADGIATAVMLLPNLCEAEAWLKKIEGKLPIERYWLVAR